MRKLVDGKKRAWSTDGKSSWIQAAVFARDGFEVSRFGAQQNAIGFRANMCGYL